MASTAVSDHSDILEAAVREFARRTRFPVAFGGLVDRDTAAVTVRVGTHTNALDGLAVRRERGLGGRAISELRPRMTGNYGSARQITHDYDSFILGEGLSTLMAVPVIVEGRARGVLYGGAWGNWGIGGVTASPAVEVAKNFASELRIHDEVERRLAAERSSTLLMSSAQREELRETYADLRRIAAGLPDGTVRARLAEIEQRLATLSGQTPDAAERGAAMIASRESSVQLTPREIDVLACVALGSTNAETAAQLGLREGTIKAYLGTAMTKLHASTRHAAVARARRLGLLP